MNVAGYVEFHPDGTQSLVCCDHTLNHGMAGISVENANNVIGGILSATVRVNQSPETWP